MIIENIIIFLVNRGWVVANETQKFIELSPPAVFNIQEGFRIYVPRDINKNDANTFLANLLQIISDFYSLTTDDLNVLLKVDNAVLKVRVYDNQTKEGKISLTRFEELVERIRQILSDTASFVIDRSVTSTRVPEEVSRYIKLCNFLQTEKGSFVAKIQLPSKELIKNRELFDREEVYSYEINKKLIEVLSFVNDTIIEGEVVVTEDYLIENEDKINIKLYKSIYSLFDKVDIKGVDFSLYDKSDSNSVVNDNITKQKLYKLNQFVEQIESQSFEIGEFSFTGKITTLKSKDPDGLRNSVTYTAIYENIPLVVSANLESEHYKLAIEAHKLKQNITITGMAKKTKSKARFIEIINFEVDDDNKA